MRLTRSLLLVLFLLSMAACGPAAQKPASASPVPDAEQSSAVTEVPLPQAHFVPDANVNCRLGPALEYPILLILTAGEQYPVLGINENADWLSLAAGASSCWAKRSTGQAFGDVGGMPFVEAPPVPVLQESVLASSEPAPGEDTPSGSGETGMVPPPMSQSDFVFPGTGSVKTCGERTTEYECKDPLAYLCVWHPSEVVCYNVIGCVTLPPYCADYSVSP